MVSLVIDTDTASDDAVALLLACGDPAAAIRAVTLVAGNVPMEMAQRNALVSLDVANAGPVPVHRGCSKPLTRPLETAQFVHGANGMSDIDLPVTQRQLQDEHAVEALLGIARDEPGQHVLVTLGPLTNVAAAVTIDPLFLTRFQRVVMMLGAPDAVGNVTATAEFNAWADPESARIVVHAPGEKWMVGWDISRSFGVIGQATDQALTDSGTPGRFAVAINESVRAFCAGTTGLSGYDLPDPIALCIAIHPEVATATRRAAVDISLDHATRGQTSVDHRLSAPPANLTVVEAASAAGFQAHLLAGISALAA